MRVFSSCALAVALLAPAGAHAATIELKPGSKYNYPRVEFKAAQGESNVLTLEATGNRDELRVGDAGAPIQAGPGCRQLTEHEAICSGRTGVVPDVSVVLGDGDDRFTAGAQPDSTYVNGGSGDDVLTGSPGGDLLYGGDGHDTIDGAAGSDSIAGDAATPFRDELSGGSGDDEVDYSEHTVPVTVNLADPGQPTGADGEDDRISGFEQATGGSAGPSLLIGTGGRNVLSGAGEGTRIEAGGGRDFVVAPKGVFVDAGAGKDRVVSAPGSRVACGAGVDRLEEAGGGYEQGLRFANLFGLAGDDCERLLIRFPNTSTLVRPYPTLRDARATFRIPCSDDPDSDKGCTGRVLMRDSHGRLLGKRRYRTAGGQTRAVGITLSDKTLRKIAGPAGLAVAVSIALNDAGERARASYTIVLTSP